MALAVCLLFDGRSERLVRDLWSRLEARGVRTLESHTHGKHRPHLIQQKMVESGRLGRKSGGGFYEAG